MNAPGAPGIPPTWTSSAKDMVGTGLGPARLWMTIGYGIVNEVYYPRADMPQIRDLGFIVADGKGFWAEVKRIADYSIATPAPGIPAVQILHRHARFELSLRIAPDPEREVLLIEASLSGDDDLTLYALLAPHLGGTGNGNSASVFVERDRTVLCAELAPFAVALAAAEPASQLDAWRRASAGFVGVSDGWQDFAHNGAMTWTYPQAGPGNVALLGELTTRTAVLALGFGSDRSAAATLAISSLYQPFDAVWRRHVALWEAWHADNLAGDRWGEFRDAMHVAAMVLRTHRDRTYPGAMVASLSIPWGNSSDDVGGYHLVWPRDLVESAGALLALGAKSDARNILRYLLATQLADGRWSQNQWLGGQPRWTGMQLDEAAFPVLLAAWLAQDDALHGIAVDHMIRRALRFVALCGPATEQDRWEETPGINTFTIATAIAALVGGAALLGGDAMHDILCLADDWNERIEEWCTASNPDWQQRYGIESYYVRSAPLRVVEDPAAIADGTPVRNHEGECLVPADTLISTDFLQLVRFGLRRADDPVVLATLKLVDALLRVETPAGPCWYRYNGDGYGEHPGGHPYNGTGQGRPWPLLTGERGHYAIAAGDEAGALTMLRAMLRMSGRCGLLPEQVWDDAPIPERGLFPGRPSGSAMPLVWAHAEFVKLVTSLRLGHPADRLEQVWLRYGGERPHAQRAHWTRRTPVGWIRSGQSLRLLLDRPAVVHWQVNDGGGQATTALGMLALHVADLPTHTFGTGQRVVFSIRDAERGDWIEQDRVVTISDGGRHTRGG